MRSTSGAYFVALDHVRAVAALLVFAWHFAHGQHGHPVPFEGAPVWGPLVLFDEGHVGVALFMTLSGYLFAKLLDGKQIIYRFFFWNRFLRLFPLLTLVLLIYAVSPAISMAIESGSARQMYWTLLAPSTLRQFYERLLELPKGLVFPTWPNGGWSITAELHFYLLLPMLLYLQRRSSLWLGLILLTSLAFRAYVWWSFGQVQDLAYWTIVGRLDQFVLGILAFHLRLHFQRRTLLVAIIFAAFLTIYYVFDSAGGFYQSDGYPSRSPMWIVLPAIEGLAFAVAIAWYETSFRHRRQWLSSAVSRVGEYSYSIYLLHFFIVFYIAEWVHRHLIDISNFYVALPVALVAFTAMVPIGHLSMRFIEAPFLRLRRPYYKVREADAKGRSGASE